VNALVDMLEAGMIDEEAALQAFKNLKGWLAYKELV
jgi:hypothetical protein